MRYRVVETHNQGTERGRAACLKDKGAVGDLVMGADGTAALLTIFDHKEANAITPLQRASVIRITRAGILLLGSQSEIVQGEKRWFVQGWWCVPANQPTAG